MNFYAINEVPFNGSAVHYGEGEPAVVELAGSGAISLARFAQGLPANIRLQVSGQGTRWVMGTGTASIALNTAGNGTRRTHGSGESHIVLEGSGNATVVPAQGGQSTIVLQMRGSGRVPRVVYGTGTAPIRLASKGKARTNTPARGRSLSQLWINQYGGGCLVLHHTGGSSEIEIRAAGVGRSTEKVYGAGKAVIELRTLRNESRQFRHVYGVGASAIEILAGTRDRRAITLPSERDPAPKARVLRISEEHRVIRVARDARTAQAEEAA